MSVAAAAASSMIGKNKSAQEATSVLNDLSAQQGGNAALRFANRRAKQARDARVNGSAVGGGVTAGAVGGDNGRLDTIESRLEALEGGTENDVTQPSPTVNVPSTPSEGVGAAPAMSDPTMGAAEKMFGGGALRQIAAGAGKFKK